MKVRVNRPLGMHDSQYKQRVQQLATHVANNTKMAVWAYEFNLDSYFFFINEPLLLGEKGHENYVFGKCAKDFCVMLERNK